jgi:DDE family transposase
MIRSDSTTGTSGEGKRKAGDKGLQGGSQSRSVKLPPRFLANQFRLLLHAAAYWLLDTLRRKLVAAGVRRMQLDTLRLRLVKIGGRVRQLVNKVRLYLASGHPGQRLWHQLLLAFESVHE